MVSSVIVRFKIMYDIKNIMKVTCGDVECVEGVCWLRITSAEVYILNLVECGV